VLVELIRKREACLLSARSRIPEVSFSDGGASAWVGSCTGSVTGSLVLGLKACWAALRRGILTASRLDWAK
jgi:hypothetical protein